MTAEPGIKSSRRKRTVVYGVAADQLHAERALRETASEVRAELHLCQDPFQLLALVESERESLCLVVLEAHFPDLVRTARLAAEKAPLCELILLMADTDQASVQQQLGRSPRLGNHWQYLSPTAHGLSRILRSSLQKADQRKATRTTLDRFNARLSVPAEAVDTQELRQLVISDRFLSSILESAFDAVILVDRSGGIAAFNPSAERLFAKSQRQALSHSIRTLSAGPWRSDIEAAFQPHQQGILIHSSIEADDGPKNVEISATPVYDRAQNLLATSLIVRDVTTRLQSEQALRTNEKLAAVGRLASSIAHEINNPLEAVTNLIYLARLGAENPEVQQYLDQADHELQRMSVITSQTLHFHKQSTSPNIVSCEALLESVIGVYHGRLSSCRVGLQMRLRARKPVSCFEGEIRQVLNNLVGNAIDAIQPSGGRLLLRSREAKNWKTLEAGVVITVADTGSGMSHQTLKKVFDAFFTTKGVGGTGLGLWISHEIILRHRGTVHVRSSQQKGHSGTVFAIFLPFNAAVR